MSERRCTCDPGPEGQHRGWCDLEDGLPDDPTRTAFHDRIRAAVEDARANSTVDSRQCAHADRILDRHKGLHRCGDWVYAREDCPEVRDLAEAWGVEP